MAAYDLCIDATQASTHWPTHPTTGLKLSQVVAMALAQHRGALLINIRMFGCNPGLTGHMALQSQRTSSDDSVQTALASSSGSMTLRFVPLMTQWSPFHRPRRCCIAAAAPPAIFVEYLRATHCGWCLATPRTCVFLLRLSQGRMV